MLGDAPNEAQRGWGDVGQSFEPPEANQLQHNVAIFGHSYVARLPLAKPKVVGAPGLIVRAFSVPGGKVSTIRNHREYHELEHFKPELTLMILGGNDITAQSDLQELAEEIERLALEIEEKTGGGCKIIGIESRTNPRGMSPDQFNRAKNGVNRRLRRSLPYSKSRFIPMSMSKEELTLADGVHLGEAGSRKLLAFLMEQAYDYINRK